jgi:hypothetical protein
MRRLANIVCAFSVAACASGPGNVVVSMQPYAPPAAANAAAPKAATVRVDAVKDARPEAVGGFVGERKGLGGMSMGSIELQPRPAELVGQLLVAELKQMGYDVTASNPQLTVAAQLLKFEVATPATAVYWDVNGTVEIALVATGENAKKHEARYGATCTDRTYVWPSEELIGKVVAACMSSIADKVRNDAALASVGGR